MKLIQFILLIIPVLAFKKEPADDGRRDRELRGAVHPRLLKTGPGPAPHSPKSPKGKGDGPSPKGKGEKSPKGKGKGESKSPKGKGKGESKSPKGKGKGDGPSPKGKGKGGKSPKGKGGKSPKGKGKGEGGSGCPTIPIYFNVDEIRAAEFETVAGFGLAQLPFYDAETGDRLGFYNDFATVMGDTDECIAAGSFSFDEAEVDGVTIFGSLINVEFTCSSLFNSIVGGAGRYSCAGGYEEFNFVTEERLATTLNVCGDLCPPKGLFD